MRIAFFLMMLTSVAALACWRGQRDEQCAAAICILGSVLTAAGSDLPQVRFSNFNVLNFVVDLGVFLAFLAIALRSSRFWPLWVAGLQLTGTSIHLMILADPVVIGRAFGAALAFWSYPILLLIGIGAWRTAAIERWRSVGTIAWAEDIT